MLDPPYAVHQPVGPENQDIILYILQHILRYIQVVR
jgi:uncharacterized membrane protein YqaE (UPF0057 family)